jgi:zinc/manganese transport system ATP-binding protein
MTTPRLALHGATMRYGTRTLFDDLDLEVAPAEFLAVLGPNGVGKSTLLKVVLGLERLAQGAVEIDGAAPRKGRGAVGYVPQLHAVDRELALRGTDLVRLGLDGHRYGVTLRRTAARARVAAAVAAVGAQGYAERPVGLLSGGEQQRLRIAQALLTEPSLLLCDEPLLGLDLHHQRDVTALLDARRRSHGTSIVFVTHEINPVLPYVDRVLYLAGGRFAVGTPDEILTAPTLSSLFGTEVEVLTVNGRLLIVGGEPDVADDAGHHHLGHVHDDAGGSHR